MVWQSKVPPRVAFFSWTAALGKILTTDNLWKRHIVVVERCFMCKMCGKSVDHLLLHCPIAYESWSMVFCLFGIHWVMLYKVSEVLASWKGKFGRQQNIGLWRFVPHCFFGAYGGSGILDALRIVNGLFLTLRFSFSILSSSGV